jgi:hypothetical protein
VAKVFAAIYKVLHFILWTSATLNIRKNTAKIKQQKKVVAIFYYKVLNFVPLNLCRFEP